jgi:hypothetical protein
MLRAFAGVRVGSRGRIIAAADVTSGTAMLVSLQIPKFSYKEVKMPTIFFISLGFPFGCRTIMSICHFATGDPSSGDEYEP